MFVSFNFEKSVSYERQKILFDMYIAENSFFRDSIKGLLDRHLKVRYGDLLIDIGDVNDKYNIVHVAIKLKRLKGESSCCSCLLNLQEEIVIYESPGLPFNKAGIYHKHGREIRRINSIYKKLYQCSLEKVNPDEMYKESENFYYVRDEDGIIKCIDLSENDDREKKDLKEHLRGFLRAYNYGVIQFEKSKDLKDKEERENDSVVTDSEERVMSDGSNKKGKIKLSIPTSEKKKIAEVLLEEHKNFKEEYNDVVWFIERKFLREMVDAIEKGERDVMSTITFSHDFENKLPVKISDEDIASSIIRYFERERYDKKKFIENEIMERRVNFSLSSGMMDSERCFTEKLPLRCRSSYHIKVLDEQEENVIFLLGSTGRLPYERSVLSFILNMEKNTNNYEKISFGGMIISCNKNGRGKFDIIDEYVEGPGGQMLQSNPQQIDDLYTTNVGPRNGCFLSCCHNLSYLGNGLILGLFNEKFVGNDKVLEHKDIDNYKNKEIDKAVIVFGNYKDVITNFEDQKIYADDDLECNERRDYNSFIARTLMYDCKTKKLLFLSFDLLNPKHVNVKSIPIFEEMKENFSVKSNDKSFEESNEKFLLEYTRMIAEDRSKGKRNEHEDFKIMEVSIENSTKEEMYFPKSLFLYR